MYDTVHCDTDHSIESRFLISFVGILNGLVTQCVAQMSTCKDWARIKKTKKNKELMAGPILGAHEPQSTTIPFFAFCGRTRTKFSANRPSHKIKKKGIKSR